MKLHEEFKLYESLWDNPVDKILQEDPVIELEFDGFSRDWEEPYASWNGYEVVDRVKSGENTYHKFTYKVDSRDIFELLRDTIIPKHWNEVPANDLLTAYRKLESAWESSTPEDEEKTCEAMELFLAEHLETFIEMFLKQLKEEYLEEAEEWAIDHLSPTDYNDYLADMDDD